MAEIVGGFASSHTPLMSLPGENWDLRAKDDEKNRELIQVPTGKHVAFPELLAGADPKIAKEIDKDIFVRKFNNLQRAMDELGDTFEKINPDVIVMFGDDQDEMMFENVMPTIDVYWGDTFKIVPRVYQGQSGQSDAIRIASQVYAGEEIDYPGHPELGLHIVETLMEREFDIATSRYMQEEYGGTIGPGTWYLDYQRTTKPRRQGIGHAFTFPVRRWFKGKIVPAVPIIINTCYPPNWISPRRAYALGAAVRAAIQSWDSDARVGIVTSGGLSHFVVDEEIDRLALEGLTTANGEILSSLPRHRLQSATTEILNWVAAAGAMGDTRMEVMAYEPGYRSVAGTGCGCAVGRWIP
jgi:3-O-methylgallate 3,4-dioxygenase